MNIINLKNTNVINFHLIGSDVVIGIATKHEMNFVKYKIN